jgi:hypothetical protein
MVGFIGLNGLAEHTDSADDVECPSTSTTSIGNSAGSYGNNPVLEWNIRHIRNWRWGVDTEISVRKANRVGLFQSWTINRHQS